MRWWWPGYRVEKAVAWRMWCLALVRSPVCCLSPGHLSPNTPLHPEDTERAAFPFGFGLRYGEAAPSRTLPSVGLQPMRRRLAKRYSPEARSVRGGGLASPTQPCGGGSFQRGAVWFGAVSLSTVDGRLQGSARRVCWNAAGGLHIQPLAAHNRPPGPAPTTLHLTLRVVDARPGVAVRLGSYDWSGVLQELSLHEWHTVALPVDALDALVFPLKVGSLLTSRPSG